MLQVSRMEGSKDTNDPHHGVHYELQRPVVVGTVAHILHLVRMLSVVSQ